MSSLYKIGRQCQRDYEQGKGYWRIQGSGGRIHSARGMTSERRRVGVQGRDE